MANSLLAFLCSDQMRHFFLIGRAMEIFFCGALIVSILWIFTRACSAACTDALFNQADKLGAMTRYLGSKGQANMNFVLGNGMKITATYVASAAFVHGSASVKLHIVKQDGEWRILGFFVHLETISSQGRA